MRDRPTLVRGEPSAWVRRVVLVVVLALLAVGAPLAVADRSGASPGELDPGDAPVVCSGGSLSGSYPGTAFDDVQYVRVHVPAGEVTVSLEVNGLGVGWGGVERGILEVGSPTPGGGGGTVVAGPEDAERHSIYGPLLPNVLTRTTSGSERDILVYLRLVGSGWEFDRLDFHMDVTVLKSNGQEFTACDSWDCRAAG